MLPMMQAHLPERQTPMDTKQEVAARLKHLRRAWGFEQAKPFAAWIGVEYSMWNHYETAVRDLSVMNALKVCQKTGASLDWLFRGLDHTLPDHVLDRLRSTPEAPAKPRKPRLVAND